LLGVALLLFAAQPDPTMVNGNVLGKAADFTTAGPARVCMDNLMVTALASESVTLDYSGIHAGSLRLNRGRSWIKITLGDIFRQPREQGEVIVRKPNFYIAEASSKTDLRYGLYAPDKDHADYRLKAWIDSQSFTGDTQDDVILRRIEMRNENSPPCTLTYHFGFDVLFGKMPLREK
jgi:hypothetical protein